MAYIIPLKGWYVMTVDEVHEKIERLMKERGWSGYKLATESNVSMSTYYNMMDRDTMPKIETLEKICDGFHITLAEFFSMDEKIIQLSEEENMLLEGFRQSDRDGRARILGFVEAIKPVQK